MAAVFLRDELNCSICLNTYVCPVTLKCGHSFCQICIDRLLASQEESGVYSCPECRDEYQKRPVLNRNVTLTKIADCFLSTHPRQVDPDISCIYCITSTSPAAKTCLLCEASLCDNHLWVHNKSPEHVLTEPTASPEKRKCLSHKKVLEFRCTEDDVYICASCRLVGDHRGHQVESLNDTAEKVKDKLRNLLEILTSMRDQIDRNLQSLLEDKRKVEEEVFDVTVQVTALFSKIKKQMKVLKKKVLGEISKESQQRTCSSSTLIRQMETRKKELNNKMLYYNQICHMTDPMMVLKEQNLDKIDLSNNEETDNRSKEVQRQNYAGDLKAGLIFESLRKVCKIVTGLSLQDVFSQPAKISMDMTTASNSVCISGDLKIISGGDTKENNPVSASRFQHYPQALSTESFSSGRHYWEVDASAQGLWRVGMAYASIKREGDESVIGYSYKSWCLCGDIYGYLLRHNQYVIKPPAGTSCNRFRIYLDYEAGRLSFYELSDPIRHLHTFTTSFTEPLHAAFFVFDSWLQLS
ncbi:E3 ubiquitin/ISG15 ligase TRIM25-like [Hyperolius riggenbachi]|uniref:E3 ubiquitin/ISG15 ligase TRIM25-like n=1 Tax=Hyperolius riggenbachi TaxID=752182 RepID=UPI0035A3D4DF